MSGKPVLIVGAGPTGLVLALWLAKRGVAVDIIDAKPAPGEGSRALAVHARTLEFYIQLGIADEIIEAGEIIEELHLHHAARRTSIATFRFGEIGTGLGPFPFVLSLAQDEHERILGRVLADMGVSVRRSTRLETYEVRADEIIVTLSTAEGTRKASYRWICGCDGAHSQVRGQMGTALEGGTYAQRFYVADVQPVSRPPDGFHIALGSEQFTLMLPIGSGSTRLIGLMPNDDPDATDFEVVRARAEAATGISVERLNWFSTYKVHHRVADRFRKGDAFLLGDAGHLHSPAGGQGMNTGIGDAVNLAWKIAAVEQDGAPHALLDTYESERRPFARELVGTTDAAFTNIVRADLIGNLTRRVLVPTTLRLVSKFAAARRRLFETISQIRISYRDSPLSRTGANETLVGQRLPWAGADGMDNFASLQSLDWQIHSYGQSNSFRAEKTEMDVPIHFYDWVPAMGQRGIARDTHVLVRPDSYIAASGHPAPDLAAMRYPAEWKGAEQQSA